MELRGEIAGRYLRIIALVALLLGLADAARLLGVTGGSQSPLSMLGTGGFVYLTIFCLARLFAAVGLWIRASWGAVLLVGATVAELGLVLMGSPHVQLDAFGFGLRLVLLLGILLIFGLRFRWGRAQE
jgi:hypothetical protein